MNKLKSCPFCGGTAKKVYKSSGQTIHIECEQCRAQFPKSTNENAFDEAWNSRAERTCTLTGNTFHALNDTTWRHCSECDADIMEGKHNYCWKCGAKVVE